MRTPPFPHFLAGSAGVLRFAAFVMFLFFFMVFIGTSPYWTWGTDPWAWPSGEPDLTGPYSSWRNIEESWLDGLLREPGWQQIVQDSPFALGEPRPPSGDSHYAAGDYGSYPSIDGSTVAAAMAVEFARQHLDLSPRELAAFASLSTTHIAYSDLIHGHPREVYIPCAADGPGTVYGGDRPVDLIIVTQPSREEQAMAEEAGVALAATPVCLDAFVFITHVDNPVDSLTLEQIRGIYSGEIKNWQEVGGEDGRIAAYQREANSGSQTAMEELVMGGVPLMRPPYSGHMIVGMFSMIDAVAEYQNDVHSIGYTYRYYLDILYRDDNIKVLAVDGVAPSDEAIQSGGYPLSVYYYGVIRDGEQDRTGGLFLDWMLSDEGQRCIAQAGYIPLPPN